MLGSTGAHNLYLDRQVLITCIRLGGKLITCIVTGAARARGVCAGHGQPRRRDDFLLPGFHALNPDPDVLLPGFHARNPDLKS